MNNEDYQSNSAKMTPVILWKDRENLKETKALQCVMCNFIEGKISNEPAVYEHVRCRCKNSSSEINTDRYLVHWTAITMHIPCKQFGCVIYLDL